MKILFTGASSFTGFWFVKALCEEGHQVVATFRQPLEAYHGLRKERIHTLLDRCKPVFGVSFGTEAFHTLIKQEHHWDILCHHAADVTNYKDPAFDPIGALSNNAFNLKNTLILLQDRGCHKVLLTGSVFEPNEGAGSDNLRAVSPYGLSKGLTSETFKFYTSIQSMTLGKFVIPNPFGPYEEARFTSFLIQNWFQGKCAPVTMPYYVRDNIHVSLLAKAYAHFANTLSAKPGLEQINPSGYPESQGAFTQRFASEMRKRLNIPCEFDLHRQKEFPEPRVRINIDLLDPDLLQWSEKAAWDELAAYYQRLYHTTSVQ